MKSKIGYVLLMSLYCASALADGGRELDPNAPADWLFYGLESRDQTVIFNRSLNFKKVRSDAYDTTYEASFYRTPGKTSGPGCTVRIRVVSYSKNPDQLDLPAGSNLSGKHDSRSSGGEHGWLFADHLALSPSPPELGNRVRSVTLECYKLESISDVTYVLGAHTRRVLSVFERQALAAAEELNRKLRAHEQELIRLFHARAAQANRKPAVLEVEAPAQPTSNDQPLNGSGR